MPSEKEYVAIFEQIASEIPGFIAISLVDLDSGMTLAVHSARPEFDLASASAFNSEMVKQKLKTISALNLNSSLDDMLLTLSDQLHLIKMVGPSAFVYLASERAGSNLAIIRNIVNRHADRLE